MFGVFRVAACAADYGGTGVSEITDIQVAHRAFMLCREGVPEPLVEYAASSGHTRAITCFYQGLLTGRDHCRDVYIGDRRASRPWLTLKTRIRAIEPRRLAVWRRNRTGVGLGDASKQFTGLTEVAYRCAMKSESKCGIPSSGLYLPPRE